VRGKFYRKGATLRLPIYLEAQLQDRLERIAKEKGRELGDVVNDLLAKEVATLERSR
jgi:cytidylate kinase